MHRTSEAGRMHGTRGRAKTWTRGSLFALVLLAASGAQAIPTFDEWDRILGAERQRALRQSAEAGALAERAKAESAERLAALDAVSSAGKADLASLQKEMLALLAKDDSATLKVVRARLAARQAALAAAEVEKALILKKNEEAEREQDAWKKRAATLDLSLRMDMKVMLATPADLDNRDKRVDAAGKEIENEAGQIRKYAARRDNAAAELNDLRPRLAALTQSARTLVAADLQKAREEEAEQVKFLIALQKDSFLLNRLLETRACRDLAFARTDYLVSRRYADAMAHKADVQRAEKSQAAAEAADARLAALRAAAAPFQQRAVAELAAAQTATETSLKTLGEARTAPDQEQANAAYALAQARKARWTAAADCWKEYLALQKAGAAFAHELADRARGVAEDRDIAAINQEESQLRESLGTSEEYVRKLRVLGQKTDEQIESERRELGIPAETVPAMTQLLGDLFGAFEAANPPEPPLISDQLQALERRALDAGAPGRLTPEQRNEVAATLAARLVQRELLRARCAISERWLDNSRDAIQTLEQLAGNTLWREHDPRLNGVSCEELVALFRTLAGDALFAWQSRRIGLAASTAGGFRRPLLAGACVLLLGLAGWACGKLISNRTPLRWLAGRWLSVLPPLLGAALLLHGGKGQPAFEALGGLLWAVAGWLALRHAMLALTRDHRAPPGATLAGGLFAALNAASGWTAVLWPLYRAAGMGENPWDVQAVFQRLWLFGICLVLFRLALHPSLAGRLLSRRSEHQGLRRLGAAVAWACVLAATLAAVPYLAGLDNLGQTVLHAVQASFALLVAALIGVTAVAWLTRRRVAADTLRTALMRAGQTVVAALAGVGVVWVWWGLLNRVVFAPNAPPPIRELVRIAGQVLRSALHIWRSELTPGMTVSGLVRGILVFALSFWVSRIAKRVFLRRVLARTTMDEATRLTFAAILGYSVILLGFLTGLNVAGSSLQNLTLLAGAITVGLGFGLQNVINNFVSSLLIHFGRTIRVGDYIDVGGTRGRVREIGLRNTMIVTDDDITVLVPNGAFISSNIVNWTNPSRQIRLHVPFKVSRTADLGALTELVASIARNQPLVLKTPAPTIEVRSASAGDIGVDLLVWTETPEKIAAIVGELTLALDRPLREKGFVA